MFLSVIYRYVCRRIAGDFWKNGRVPPLLQMIYGRPQLEFAADEFTGPDSKQLIVGIKNQRTGSQLLRTLGVEREIGA
jgi:hypothetical protein